MSVKVRPAHGSASVASTSDRASWRAATFRVIGTPVPQGSLSPKRNRKTGRIVLPQSPALKRWRDAVHWCAMQAWRPHALLDGPVAVVLQFSLPRPGTVKKRRWPHMRPDIDKLTRSVLDGMEGAVYTQDARVVQLFAAKRYAVAQPGVVVEVREVEEDEDRCPHCGGIECDPRADCERREAAEEWNPSCGES